MSRMFGSWHCVESAGAQGRPSLRLGAAVLAGLVLAVAACGGGSADEKNNEALQALPVYGGAIEVDRHAESVDVDGEPGRVLRVQYATEDDRETVQAFYGEKLLRAGFRTDTAPDPSLPREALRFITPDGKGRVVLTFATQAAAWAPDLGVTPGAAVPAGAATFFVVSVRAE